MGSELDEGIYRGPREWTCRLSALRNFTISLPKFRFLAARVALFVKKVRVWGRERLGGDDASYTLPGKTSVQV